MIAYPTHNWETETVDNGTYKNPLDDRTYETKSLIKSRLDEIQDFADSVEMIKSEFHNNVEFRSSVEFKSFDAEFKKSINAITKNSHSYLHGLMSEDQFANLYDAFEEAECNLYGAFSKFKTNRIALNAVAQPVVYQTVNQARHDTVSNLYDTNHQFNTTLNEYVGTSFVFENVKLETEYNRLRLNANDAVRLLFGSFEEYKNGEMSASVFNELKKNYDNTHKKLLSFVKVNQKPI